jgi:hypothetical protein
VTIGFLDFVIKPKLKGENVMKKNEIQVGDQVKYSVKFLRSIGAYTGTMPFSKGHVKEINKLGKDLSIATIEWNFPDTPWKVNVKNLVVVGKVEND